MKVLLTNITLATRTGTEVVTRDLAFGLQRAGHEPCVFSPRLGTVSDEIAAAGIPVVSRLEDVPFRPDIIHGHHHVETTLALLHFRSVPAIFVCHDRLSWYDSPPRLKAIRRYVAVDHNCLERLVIEAGLPEERIRVIYNAVDLQRFMPRAPLPERPARALVFSNYAIQGENLEILREACENAGIEFSAIGAGVGKRSCRPEELLGGYDLVFAKARCALEALATGCAVVLCDRQGIGPMVTSSQVRELRKWNFGMRCLQGRLYRDAVAGEIGRYCREDARQVSEFIRSDAPLDLAVAQYTGIYREVIADSEDVLVSAEEAVGTLARGAGSLESTLRSLSGRFFMPPLPPTVGAEIQLRVSRAIGRMYVGQCAEFELEVDNRSAETLASRPPFPVHFAYHWLDPVTRDCIVFDGERTELASPIQQRTRSSHNVRVRPPDRPGRYLLALTLVQELKFWFDTISPPVAVQTEVYVMPAADADCKGEISLGEVASWVDAQLVRDGRFANLGFLSDPAERMLTFVIDRRFLAMAKSSQQVCGVLTTPELAGEFPPHLAVAVADDPKRSFFDIHNRLVNQTEFYGEDVPTVIHPSARLHPRSWIDEKNVRIAAGVQVGANAVISGRCSIGENTTIHAGVVIGSAGFQTSSRSHDRVELLHAGGVQIGAGCHVFANAVIARGLFREDTQIGSACRIGNCAFVSHNCRVADGTFIGHGSVVNGGVRIGKDTWIGPGATIVHGVEIGERASVSLGATVIRNLQSGQQVTGSLAIEHRKMLRLMAAAEKGSRHA